MKMNAQGYKLTLESSGRVLHSTHCLIGLNSRLDACDSEGVLGPLSLDEREELADWMIERWTKFKQLPLSAK